MFLFTVSVKPKLMAWFTSRSDSLDCGQCQTL